MEQSLHTDMVQQHSEEVNSNSKQNQQLQRERVNAAREQLIPVQDENSGKVSEFSGNIATSSKVSDETAVKIRDAAEKGKLSYTPVSNETQMKNAVDYVTANGIEKTVQEYTVCVIPLLPFTFIKASRKKQSWKWVDGANRQS